MKKMFYCRCRIFTVHKTFSLKKKKRKKKEKKEKKSQYTSILYPKFYHEFLAKYKVKYLDFAIQLEEQLTYYYF